MKKLMKRLKNERGLTLVELLAVVVILAIIAVIAFVMIGKVIENSKKDAHISNAQQLISSAKLYHANGGEKDEISSGELEEEGYVDTLIDPWTKDSKDYSGTVKRVDNKYTVTMTGGKSCTITAKDELQLSGGRDTACN